MVDFLNFFNNSPKDYSKLKSCCHSFRICAINNIPVVFFGEFHDEESGSNVMDMVNEYLPYIYFRCGRRLTYTEPARICLFLETDAGTGDAFSKGVGSTLVDFKFSFFYTDKKLMKSVFPDLKIIYSDFLALLENYLGYNFFREGLILWNNNLVEDVEHVYDYIFYDIQTFNINKDKLLTKYVFSLKRLLGEFNARVRERFISLYKKMISTLKKLNTKRLWLAQHDTIEVVFMRLRDINLFIYFLKSLFKKRYALYLFWVGGSHLNESFDYFLNAFSNTIHTESFYQSSNRYQYSFIEFPMNVLEVQMEKYVYSKFVIRENFNKNLVLEAIQTEYEKQMKVEKAKDDIKSASTKRINDNDEKTSHSAKKKLIVHYDSE